MEEKKYTIPTKVLQQISPDFAFEYRVVPIEEKYNTLILYTDAKTKLLSDIENELNVFFDKKIIIQVISTEEINNYLQKNYRKRNGVTETLNYSDDFLMNIIHEAKEIGSSDIHFEAYDKLKRVRYRIDGKLIEKYIISDHEYPKIINRIKIMGGMDISEKRLPQDGRINIVSGNEDFDIRASSLPTLYGEKIVLRILSKNNVDFKLDKLGFDDNELKDYSKSIKKPNGIILISGPTGSGKTTTLYATLKELNKNDRNILTIEDPVEYTLDGVNQVQLKEDIGLDFASTLRTFLRQDPDIIMVGEIRDVATANMAIRAALTGHLVLSTIHTNSAWGTISRLLDMGVPPFLIASTLNVSVAQRLVRKLCDFCKHEENLLEYKEFSGVIKKNYKAIGCEHCYQTGYKGRKAIYEIIVVTKELIECIKTSKMEIDDYLSQNKIKTLKDNALKLVNEGVTSIDEVYSILI